MMTDKPARRYRSPIVTELLSEITPVEKLQISTKLTLAARLDNLILTRGWSKKEFAERLGKNPSEITKWLSGTQNFTVETLTEIAFALDMPVAELFAPKQVQIVNKVHFVVQVKHVQPSIRYVTPCFGGDVIPFISSWAEPEPTEASSPISSLAAYY